MRTADIVAGTCFGLAIVIIGAVFAAAATLSSGVAGLLLIAFGAAVLYGAYLEYLGRCELKRLRDKQLREHQR